MRRNFSFLYKTPKNIGVAPRYDVWNEKYEPLEHMRRMGRLVGTGFYIPPEWYNHFRLFPPINHNFQPEKTLNPTNRSEPTGEMSSSLSTERMSIRNELKKKSRLLASVGSRYYNIFWIRKPLDRMEKNYFDLERKGVRHDVALTKVLQTFYDELAAKKTVLAMQAAEAKISGKFISMKEAVVVINVLSQLQNKHFSPHQASLLVKHQFRRSHNEEPFHATIHKKDPLKGRFEEGTEGALSPDSLANFLSEDGIEVHSNIHPSKASSIAQLNDFSTDHTGAADWYCGYSPEVS